MLAGDGPDTENNIINSNVPMHEINISTKPIWLLNKWILNNLLIYYSLVKDEVL